MKRILMMIMCVVMALSMFGCSSESKYMSLKNEVKAEMKKVENIPGNFPATIRAENFESYEKQTKDIESIRDKIVSKLKEMENLSKNDLKLSKDLEEFATETMVSINTDINVRKNNIKSYKEAADRKAGKIAPKESLSDKRSKAMEEIFGKAK